MKIDKHITDRRKHTINHLNRIEGQLKTLRRYIAADRHCSDIASLTTSIAKSFDSLRARTLEGFIMNELLQHRRITPSQKQNLNNMLNLHKK